MSEKISNKSDEGRNDSEPAMDGNFFIFKIRGDSNVVKTSDAIVKSHHEGKSIELQAVGAGAVNQAVKAIAAATGKLASGTIEIVTKIGFKTVQIEGVGERTTMVFKLLETGN